MSHSPPATAPLRAEDYEERLARKSCPRSTPFAVDWLITRHLLRSLRHAAASYARGRLLDVGCGGRPHEATFLPYVERYVGVDTPASTLSRFDVAVVASHLPFAGGSFDTILCTEVLEHLSDPAACLGEMARVLRPGGHLILTTPQMWHLHEEPYDFFRFTRYGLAHLCRSADLEVVEIRPHGGAWAMIGIMVIIHLGSYARLLSQRVNRGREAGAGRPSPTSSDWQAGFWPLRLPICLFNLIFAALDAIPDPGGYTVDHMVVARKLPAMPPPVSPGPREPLAQASPVPASLAR